MATRSKLHVRQAARDGAIVLLADGVLDSTTYLQLRDTIIKAALDEPVAVVVNISALRVPASSAYAVLTSARWQVSRWPDVPVLVVCGHAPGRDALRKQGIERDPDDFRLSGLHMVAALSDTWGWAPSIDGKTVWATITA